MTQSNFKFGDKLKGLFASKSSEPTPETPLKKEGFFYRNRFVFLAFAIPFVLMIYAFYCAEFFPFGQNQVMVIDMWHQFFQFFKILHEKLQTGGSLLYTWQGGAGTNFIALISYYAASPVYLLSIFCPTEYLTEALAMAVVLKIALSGAFMCIFLRNMFGKNDFGTATFAILYALSAFAMGYYWCVMWLDVMALLPLCMLGLNRLIDQGKFRLYVISLALMMLTNYYIGIMMCMFIVLYYPVLYFSRSKLRGVRHCVETTVKTVMFSAIGCCMAAIVLIPTYLSMQNTYYIDTPFPASDTFANPILDVISNLLPNVELTVRGGLPNIYCGLISFMLAVLFLMCKSVPIRQKVLNCLLLAFLILSFNWNKLDFIWHGLHFPNELPYRYSFVFSFLLVTMAYQAFTKLDDITPAQIGAVTGGGFIYILLAEKLYSDKFDYKVIYLSLALLAAYALVLAIHKSGRYKESLVGVLLFIVVFGEMTNYTISSVNAVGHSSRTTFYSSYDDIEQLITKVEEDDPGFYRMELARNWTTNDPALYGYNGISQFSSEINSNVTAYMKGIGLAGDPASNRFGYFMQTPIANAMLNLKYIIGKSETVDDFALGNALYTCNGSTIYRNKYPLSIGYMANDDILDWDSTFGNPFDTQNQFAWFASGISTPVMNMLTNPVCSGGYASLGTYSNGTLSCTNTAADASTTVQLEFVSDKAQPIYAFVYTPNASTVSARVENGSTVNFESNRGSIMSLGSCEAGEKVYVNITYEAGKAGQITSYVYGLDTAVWDRVYQKLNDEALEITSYSDTKIEGTVTAQQDGIFMTSIPYERGWSCKVDGQSTEVFAIEDAMCAIQLTAGEHTITFSYIPAGFITGTAITVVSIVALVALYYVNKRREQRLAMLAALEADMVSVSVASDDTMSLEQTASDYIDTAPSDELPTDNTTGEQSAVGDIAEPYIDAQPITEPVVEPITEPVTDPITEPIIEPVAEPITEPEVEPVAEPIVEPVESEPPTPADDDIII